ncbi:MAG TPA: hypothetical protein VEC06_04770 [Paucimonas sp.]|nr:hypothetical protein [Paucimonas sp.]
MAQTPHDAPGTDDAGDIAKAGPRGRMLLAGVVLFALAMAAAFHFHALPLLQAAVSGTPTPDNIVAIKAIFIGIAGLGALTAIAWIRYALRMLRHRQDPPPGAWLWRDTKIVRGAAAVRRARLSIAGAVLACAVCIGFAAYIAIALDRLAAQLRAADGIEIVHRKIIVTK